jgi:hypothetical protein
VVVISSGHGRGQWPRNSARVDQQIGHVPHPLAEFRHVAFPLVPVQPLEALHGKIIPDTRQSGQTRTGDLAFQQVPRSCDAQRSRKPIARVLRRRCRMWEGHRCRGFTEDSKSR